MNIKVLDWRKRRNWLASVRHYAGHVLTTELRQYLSQERPKCWSDDFSWLPDSGYILPEFVSSLTRYYTHFKGFHGCRPLTLSSYYERGLLGQNSDLLCSVFRELFYDVPKEHVEKIIQQFGDRGNRERGAIWLVGSDQYLVDECGHYLIQGSEYLMALAAHLGSSPGGEDYRFRLRGQGVPTVLEIDVPIGLVPAEQHVEVAKMILSEWGQLAARRPLPFGKEPPCYVVRQDIPPECVRGHCHPERIVDPHRGHRLYVNRLLTCDVCG
ncbi:hypothetical protein [Paraburkholderia diazotrophica]|uniref:hypothetical protein n=1 Tax=Paraburkholderia diazotrophica TaxID=667676 RepID=UPI00316C37C3